MERWRRKIERAKRLHRPSLRDWRRDGFGPSGRRSDDFESFVASAADRDHSIPRVHCSHLSPQEFWERYEAPGLPVLIEGIPGQQGWRALDRWSFARLSEDPLLRSCKVKCGEDDDGYAVKVKLKHFLRYTTHQQDDSPLYVFDSHFDEHKKARALLDDFAVPDYFPDDLFETVGERRRPPYRWFLVGPRRSGTMAHIDPLGTSAWNTVIVGRKRWVIFPPDTDKAIAKGKAVMRDGEDDEPVNFFVDLLPRLKRTYGDCRMCEFTQYPGDTVFIPGGWWHAVLNLDDTVAITQNFCSHRNFDQVWRKTRKGRKKMGVKWLATLDARYLHLAIRARELNAMDGFLMPSHHKRKNGSAHDTVSKNTTQQRTRTPF